MVEQLHMALEPGDLWPARLPPGAACFDWFIAPVDWPALHAANAAALASAPAPSVAGTTMADPTHPLVADGDRGDGGPIPPRTHDHPSPFIPPGEPGGCSGHGLCVRPVFDTREERSDYGVVR